MLTSGVMKPWRRGVFANSEEKGIGIALAGEVDRNVRRTLARVDQIVEGKRERLKELIRRDEEEYSAEFEVIWRYEERQKEEEEERKAIELKTRAQRERQEIVEQKLLEQKIINCEEARPLFVKQNLIQIKEDQKWQILEKQAIEEERVAREKAYHKVMVNKVLELKEKEEEKKKILWTNKKVCKETYLEQIRMWKDKKLAEKAEEEMFAKKRIDEDHQKKLEEQQKEWEEKKKKAEEVTNNIKKCLVRDRDLKARRKKEEEALDQIYIKLAKNEIQKERSVLSDKKEKLKQELRSSKVNFEELRRQKELENRQHDEMLKDLNEKMDKDKEEQRERLEAARRELHLNVIRGRDEQVREKHERAKSEKAATVKEHLEEHQKVSEIKQAMKSENKKALEEKLDYGRQLLNQMMEKEERKRREKQQKEEYLKAVKEQETQTLAEVSVLAKQPIIRAVHPVRRAFFVNKTPNYVGPFPVPNP